MRVVVTGANGYIGSRLVNSLSRQGHEVFAVDLSFERCHVKRDQNVHLITIPIEQLNSDSFGGV